MKTKVIVCVSELFYSTEINFVFIGSKNGSATNKKSVASLLIDYSLLRIDKQRGSEGTSIGTASLHLDPNHWPQPK